MKLLYFMLLVVISLVNAYVPSDFETDKIIGIKLNLNNNIVKLQLAEDISMKVLPQVAEQSGQQFREFHLVEAWLLKNKAGSFGEDRYNVTVQVLQYASDSQSVERNDLSIDYLQQMYPPFSCILNGWHLLEAK